METYEYLAAIVLAYLIGSLSSALWIGKIFYGIDIRKHGSSNSGATNAFRVLGKNAGIPVLIIDICKGSLAVLLAFVFFPSIKGSESFIGIQYLLGFAAVLGHVFPIYAGFRGGKGIATLLGIMIVIEPMAAGVSVLVFILMLALSGFVSLSSISGVFVFPLISIFVFKSTSPAFVVFSFAAFILVLLTHRENLQRLFDRTESRVTLIKRNK